MVELTPKRMEARLVGAHGQAGVVGTHCSLGICLSFIHSITVDASWPGPHLHLMASNSDGNRALNTFLIAHATFSMLTQK